MKGLYISKFTSEINRPHWYEGFRGGLGKAVKQDQEKEWEGVKFVITKIIVLFHQLNTLNG